MLKTSLVRVNGALDESASVFSRRATSLKVALAVLFLIFSLLPLQAFPPAPFFTIYGDVRDQYGILIPAGGATVILSQGSREVVRAPLTSVAGANYSYQIRMRIDMMRLGTASYSSLAVNAGAAFTLTVDIGGVLFYPIEMTRPNMVGSPADRHRLDLTLGADTDGDGLPDAWEEAQLYQAGYQPGPNGWDLSLIDRNGDFDHDGLSNWSEYVAGTYAADPTVTLQLKIKEKTANTVRLEFYAIYGKSYTLESSTDLQTWVTASFNLSDPAVLPAPAAQSILVSSTTGILSVYVGTANPKAFYRLTVR